MSVAYVIGRTTAQIVKDELTRPGVTAPARRAVLVRTLERGEVAELLADLEGLVVPGSDAPVEIAVSIGEHREADALLGRFATDRTMTHHRSRVSTGLVLVELDPFSDVSGQRHFRAITDRDLLGGAEDGARRQTLLSHAWKRCGGGDQPLPAVVAERLERLAQAFVAIESSVRPWVGFLLDVLERTSAGEIVTPAAVEAHISECLPTLGLFRDPRLFMHRNLQRELARNRHVAQLRDPSGRELEQEELLRRIESARFAAADEHLSQQEEAERRSAARAYILERSLAHRKAAPVYREWLRVFEAKARRGLGEQIRAHLTQGGLELPLERFEELAIEADLDDKDQDAAQRLLDDEADVADGRNLSEVLPVALRRRVERLAMPDMQRVDEPLRGILQALVSLAGDEGAAVELRPLDGSVPTGTLGVFAMLYGPTLRAVSNASEGAFSVHDDLLRVRRLPTTRDAEDDGDSDETDDWSDLRLALSTQDGESTATLSWGPADLSGLALFVRLIENRARLAWPLSLESFDDFAERARDGAVPGAVEDDRPPTHGWPEQREGFLADCARTGLDPEALERYCDAWVQLAGEMADGTRSDAGLRSGPLPRFLDMDLAMSAGGEEIWMLATHPLRLRWLARDLTELRGHLSAAVRGDLKLNPENSNLFFRWLARVSPHRQPPMLCSSERTYLPAQEVGLHEQYIRAEVHRESLGEQMDARTIGELAGVLDSYLDTFPSKVDRFVLLLLTRVGDVKLVERLVRRVLIERKARAQQQVLELHVVAPVQHHAAISASLGALPLEETGASLLPQLRTLLHAWPAEGLPPLDSILEDVDIAVVPDVLGSRSTLNDGTGGRQAGPRFDPWLDKPVSVPLAARHTTDVTIELLPAERDSAMEHWSTLNIRRRRQPVGTDAGDVDRVSLAVDVNRGLDLFQRLHEIAQWVVTVDEFVGREQIDAIDDPPDVILVRPGTGKNELYTLVVSSRAGREFVEGGLRRKLARLDLDLGATGTEDLASRLYDLARNTAPGVVLRAIGLGRTLEEILGLVTTRVLINRELPSPPGIGADWWVSLDEHMDWFGGALKPRADLLRVSIRTGAERPELHIDVVESKFRRTDDVNQAIRQVNRTIRILEAGLDPGAVRADSQFWREELVRALDGVSRRTVPLHDLPGFSPTGGATDAVLDGLRHAVREGNYAFSLRGIACSIAVEIQGDLARSQTEDVEVLRAPKGATQQVLRSIAGIIGDAAGVAPAPSDGSVAVAVDVAAPAGIDDVVASSSSDVPVALRKRRLSEDELRRRLQSVVDKLDELRVPVGVPDTDAFDEGPGFYVLRVLPGRGVRVQQIVQRSEDLELALRLDARQALRIYTHRGSVVIEVPKNDDERYSVGAASLWSRIPVEDERLVIPIGEDIAGNAVTLDLSSADSPHVLLAGMTGSGKSVALRTIIEGASRYEPTRLRILAVDPKKTELKFLEGGVHLLGDLGLTPPEAVEILDKATYEMERRYQLMADKRVSGIDEYNRVSGDEKLPWWLVVLDEYADLANDAADRREIEPRLLRIAQKARAAGIHLVVATQRPSADILNSSIRANFAAQLGLRVRSQVDSQIIIGEAGAEALAGKGDALLRTNRGTVRVQCALVQVPEPLTSRGPE